MSFGTPWTIHIYVMVRVLPLEPLEPWPWKEAVTTVQNTTSQVQTTRRNMHGCTYKDLFFWFLSDLIWGTIWPCLQYCLQSWERGCFATRVAGWTKNTVGWVTFGGDQSSYGSIRWITKYCDNLSGRLWAISAYRKLREKTSTMPCVSFCGTEIWFQRFESPCCKIRKSNPPRSKSVKLTTICLKMTSILFISPPKNGSTLKQS